MLDREGLVQDIAAAVERFAPGARRLASNLEQFVVGREAKRFREAAGLYRDIGIPDAVARSMASLHTMHSALDIIEVAQDTGTDTDDVAQVYFLLGEDLRIDWLRDQVERLAVEGRWQAMARNSMRENLYHLQGQLTQQVVTVCKDCAPADAVSNWVSTHQDRVSHVLDTAKEMVAIGTLDFPTLSVAMQEIRRLTQL
jgi:glutamate dehydrogenase